jgi:hypothetical protein
MDHRQTIIGVYHRAGCFMGRQCGWNQEDPIQIESFYDFRCGPEMAPMNGVKGAAE